MQRFCWTNSKIFGAVNSVRNICSCLSFCHSMDDKRCRNGNFRSCYLLWWYFFDLEGTIWEFSRVIFSGWIPVSSWCVCCSTWIRSRFSIGIFWFVAASIFRWCCKSSFSAWVFSDEKTSEKYCFHSTHGVCFFPVRFSVAEDSGFSRGLFPFSVVFLFVPQIFPSKRFSSLLSVVVIIIIFFIRRSVFLWISMFVSTLFFRPNGKTWAQNFNKSTENLWKKFLKQ